MTTIGIIGGGQLGLMLIEAAKSSGLDAEYFVLESQLDCPAAKVADKVLIGNILDYNAILEFSNHVDIITWEIEHINVEALLFLSGQGKLIIPHPEVLEIIKDKGVQKQFYKNNNLPTAPFLIVDWTISIQDQMDVLKGDSLVVKFRTGGYDGKGVLIMSKTEFLEDAFLYGKDILIEQFAEDATEISVIVAVGQDGNLVTFPSIEMYFNSNSNLVEFLFSPAQISEESDIHSKEIAISAVKALKSAGLFAVELFLFKDGVIWINEIAPRPHNSGHHTIEGCVTSQFLQLNNILLDRKLEDTSLIKPSAMINIVGPEDFEGTYSYAHIDWLNSQKGCFLHDYGKTMSKANRKLGHITVISENMQELIQKCETVKRFISVKPS